MKIPLLPSLLVLTLGTGPSLAAQEETAAAEPQPAAQEAPAQQADSQFGEPLIVNGERIPDLEIMRFLVYGPGRNALEARKLEILMEMEVQMRRSAARERMAEERYQKSFDELTEEERKGIDDDFTASLGHLKITREDAKQRIAEQRAEFKERYPTLDPDIETRRAYRSVAWYEDQVFQTMRFDELFFPGHPDNWPEISIEAIHAGSPNYDLVEDYATHWEARAKTAEETGEPMKREEDMMMSILRDYVMSALNSLVETRTSVDGIDPELVMEIEGPGTYAEIPTREVYEEFKDAFTWRDIAEAKRFLALQTAARQELEGLGVLTDRDEYLAEVAKAREELAANMFNWQFIALMGHQFPSEEAYTEHVYLMESFRKLIADQLVRNGDGSLSPELEANMEYANMVMGLARCLTEVCFVSAFDFPKNEWRPDGFKGALERANALRAEVDAYIDRLHAAEQAKMDAVAKGENYEWPEDLPSFDRFWSDFLDLHSEFWDPPLPMTGHPAPELGRKNKGRFNGEPMTRNDYRRTLGESSYYTYLFNKSTTDHVFLEQEPGSVGGPYIGPWGYYIIYLRSRTAPTNPIDLNSERHFQMMVDDYVRNEFTKFAHQALENAETHGVPDGLGN